MSLSVVGSSEQYLIISINSHIIGNLTHINICSLLDIFSLISITCQNLIGKCQKIVCMKGPQKLSSARARYEGYKDVCAEKQMEERTVETDFSFNMGLTAAEEMLEKYPDVDGIVACNDMVAISAYKVLHKNHISVPDQVQIIGFDDIFLSTLLTPELTTITQPIKAIGTKAAELIIHSDVQEMNMEKYIFPVSLVERETTRRK